MDITIDYGFPINAGTSLEACTGSGQDFIGDLSQPGVTYVWSPNTLLSSTTVSNPQVNFVNNGTTPLIIDYTVEATNGVCTETDQVTVTIDPLPVINAPNTVSICIGEVVELSASGGTTYNWTPASLFFDPSASSQSFAPTSDALITVTAANQYGCTNSTEVDLTVYSLPQIVFFPPDTSSCPPYEFELSIDPSSSNYATLTWSLNGAEDLEGEGNNWTGTLTEPGFYHVTYIATSADGCAVANTQPSVYEIYPEPSSIFDYTPQEPSTIFNQVDFLNWSIDAEQNSWWVEDNGPFNVTDLTWLFDEDAPGDYTVCLHVENTYGCTDSTCQTITIANDKRLFVPNAFTPDNNDLNEVFKPVLLGYDETHYEFSIIDRWGITIFSTNNVNEGWTGDVINGGHYTQNDVFEWRIKVKDKVSPEYFDYRGHVTVLR